MPDKEPIPMRSLQLATFLTASALTLVAVGCGSNRPDWEPSDPEEQVALVKVGITKATGTIDATSVKEIFDAYQVGGSKLAIVLGALATTNFAGESCVTKSADEGSVDLDCASEGAASGTIDFSSDDEITAESSEIFIEFSTEDACVDGTCFEATFAMEAKGSIGGLSTTLAASADEGDIHTFIGVEAALSSEQETTKLALFDSGGRSYTFVAAVDGSFILEGANGSFACTPSGSGGSCTGATEFDF
jgi:hypothetical protein